MIFISNPPTPLVKEEDALKIPAVKSAIQLISNSISQLPIYLYEENFDRSVNKVENDNREFLLNSESNKYDTAQVLKKKIIQDYLLRGKAYIYVNDNKLHYLEARNIREDNYTEDGFTIAKKNFIYEGLKTVTLNESKVIVIDSGTNGLLVDGGQLFSIGMQQLDYTNGVFKNGALPIGLLKSATRLTEPAINRLRNTWDSLYTGATRAGKTIILEEGLDYQSISLKPDELNLVDSNKQMTSEICRIFNIPESMINSNANKYASNEANNIQFLQNCLSPIITAIESAFDKYLLTDAEKQLNYYFRFDTSEILRTTEAEKIINVSTSLKDGLISFNEARSKLDMKPTEKDYFILSLGNVLKDVNTGELKILNLGTQLEDKTTKKEENKIDKDGTKK